MQIFNEVNENKNLAIALGYFDGVHLGHQAVIKSAVDFAKMHNVKSAVMTFKDHPCCHLYGVCPKYILSRKQREKRIADLGVDFLYELDFSNGICNLSARDYLEQILVKNFLPVSISTGFNHNFGANKSGNVEFLQENQSVYGYKYLEISPQKLGGEIISSTLIRSSLQNGEIEKANSMLGLNFSLSGEIVEGQKLGRKLGFRTANVLYPPEIVDIPFGVYEVNTNYGKGITNFGIRPTVNNSGQAVLETHILGLDKDIYGENLDIEFVKMLRPERKFNSIDELKAQIQKDINYLINA